MEKITKTYRFNKDVIKHSETNPLINSFSEWCCDKYMSEFMNIEQTALKINDLYSTIEKLKSNIKELKKKENNFDFLSVQELNWIKEDALNRPHPYNEGVYKFFVNTFNRRDINRRQFHLILDRLGGKND